MEVILTVDVEDWYQTSNMGFHHETWDRYEDRVKINTLKLLDLFDEYNAKGTFFILGYIAEKHPELVLEIFNRGHEIGCHSSYHKMINEMGREEAIEDIKQSKAILEKILKENVKYFRAPSWSIGKSELWLLHELKGMGFSCDSSIQPFRTPLSGIWGAPIDPFIPIVSGQNAELVEFPSSVLGIGPFKIPFSGGFYMRLLPYTIFKWCLEQRNKKSWTMIYCHPWEYDTDFPKVRMPLVKKIIQYYNIKGNTLKLIKLLSEYECISLGDAIEKGTFPAKSIR